MSLINEKEYDLYEYKPIEIDVVINKKHYEYENNKRIITRHCPSCKSDKYIFAFDKYSFHYVQCKQCMSLYVQNTLSEEEIYKYEQYLNTELYATNKYNEYINALSNRVSCELELTFSRLFSKKKAINIAYLGDKSKVYKNAFNSFNIEFTNIRTTENLKSKEYDLIIIDHFLEKSKELDLFMEKISSSLSDNGFLYITMRVGSGLDILTLWEDSVLYPLEHNNLLSIDGIKILFDRSSFVIKELNTPGVLDINNILKIESNNIPRFLKYLNKSENKRAIEEFQTFIQKNLLSSFATIIAQKG